MYLEVSGGLFFNIDVLSKIRHLWQLRLLIFQHRHLICAVPINYTGRQQQTETNSQTESSEGTASEDDELEILKQQLAVKNYTEKVLKEQLAIKERELAEVDLRNRQLIYKLDKEKNENLKLSEVRKSLLSIIFI